jgi:hypothetical protein
MFIIKKDINDKLSKLDSKSDNLDLNKVYEVKYNDNKGVTKRYRFLKIFVEDKENNSRINLAIPLIFFPFAIFFKDNPNVIDINTKDSIVKIYLD